MSAVKRLLLAGGLHAGNVCQAGPRGHGLLQALERECGSFPAAQAASGMEHGI
jgi:hypothetical protein